MSTTIERRFTSSKAAGVEVRAAGAGGGPGTLVGYGAVYFDRNDPGTAFMLWDDLEERVLPGCFDRALREKDDTRILFNHDPNLILGRTAAGTARLSSDTKGLKYEADAPDTQPGRDAVTSVRRGDVTGSSFGFQVEEDEVIRETRNGQPYYIRNLISVRLFDCSPCVFNAYGAATAGVRSGGPPEMRAAIVARAKDAAPAPDDAAALKAKADADAQIAIDAEARKRRLQLAEME